MEIHNHKCKMQRIFPKLTASPSPHQLFFFLILHCEYSEFGSNAFKCLQTFPIYTQIEGCTKADRRNQLCSAMKVAMSDIVLSLAASESELGKWYLKEYLGSYILTGHVL